MNNEKRFHIAIHLLSRFEDNNFLYQIIIVTKSEPYITNQNAENYAWNLDNC